LLLDAYFQRFDLQRKQAGVTAGANLVAPQQQQAAANAGQCSRSRHRHRLRQNCPIAAPPMASSSGSTYDSSEARHTVPSATVNCTLVADAGSDAVFQR
jgi:hypothetical protein